jgi:hypothetical protein
MPCHYSAHFDRGAIIVHTAPATCGCGIHSLIGGFFGDLASNRKKSDRLAAITDAISVLVEINQMDG